MQMFTEFETQKKNHFRIYSNDSDSVSNSIVHFGVGVGRWLVHKITENASLNRISILSLQLHYNYSLSGRVKEISS